MRVQSEEVRQFHRDVTALCLIARAKPYTGEVRITFRVYRPRKARDLTNCLKVTEDALTGHCYIDDAQVVEVHAFRFEDKENPRVEVDVEELPFVEPPRKPARKTKQAAGASDPR